MAGAFDGDRLDDIALLGVQDTIRVAWSITTGGFMTTDIPNPVFSGPGIAAAAGAVPLAITGASTSS